MRKFNAENERIKRRYLIYLKEALGLDQKSLDKVLAALVKFEESTNYRSFKKFHIEQAGKFKFHLSKVKSATGKPLSITTTDATLRLVKGFFQWLAGQQGFKKVLSYSDVQYFNNNRNDARAAHAQRPVHFPSIQAAFHAFQAMPVRNVFEQRNKAVFAFLMLTGARDGAVASLKLKHINLVDGNVYQDGREVKTKNRKTFTTTFFPVDRAYLDCFTSWVSFLRQEKFFGPEDALFPKPARRLAGGKFVYDILSRENYSNAQKINHIVRTAFFNVQMHPYTPHSFRKTLGLLMNDLELTLEQQKAWSQNMGHENFTTTVSSYLPVSEQRQKEIIGAMSA